MYTHNIPSIRVHSASRRRLPACRRARCALRPLQTYVSHSLLGARGNLFTRSISCSNICAWSLLCVSAGAPTRAASDNKSFTPPAAWPTWTSAPRGATVRTDTHCGRLHTRTLQRNAPAEGTGTTNSQAPPVSEAAGAQHPRPVRMRYSARPLPSTRAAAAYVEQRWVFYRHDNVRCCRDDRGSDRPKALRDADEPALVLRGCPVARDIETTGRH
jgi:hypothetical protein